jgi:GxxExxY protein
LCFDLSTSGLKLERQKPLPLVYRGVKIDCAYRADLVVAGQVLVEVKAMESLAPIHSQQLYTYLRIADCRVGLLLNFGARTMKDGIKRVVNGFPE